MYKFYKSISTIDAYKLTHYIEMDSLVSEPEIKEVLSSLVTMHFLQEYNGEVYGEMELEIELESIEEDEYLNSVVFSNYNRVRPELTVSMLSNPNDIIYNIVRLYPHDIEEQRYGVLMQAEAGQDAAVTHLEIISPENPREKAITVGQRDCLAQLKKYFQITGTQLRRGIFVIAETSNEEYDEMVQERELILD